MNTHIEIRTGDEVAIFQINSIADCDEHGLGAIENERGQLEVDGVEFPVTPGNCLIQKGTHLPLDQANGDEIALRFKEIE